MKETQEILKQMGFSNPNSNVWRSDWFGVFILLETATPEDLGKFIYTRGINSIQAVMPQPINAVQSFAVPAESVTYAHVVPYPNSRPIHVATGNPTIINLP